MSIFGFYFVTGLLRAAGWPRKQGLFQKTVVDTTILDAATNQMIDWSASLGAERPRVALQMVAEMFRDRDWNAEDAPNIAMFVEEARANWNATPPGAAPHDIIEAVPFSKNFGKSMNIEAFNDNRARAILEQWCLEGLLWGLANPSEFAAWYAMHMKRYAETSTFARQSGLAIDAAPQELSHLVQDGERILRDYEREVQQLPQIPPRLLSDAQAIGRALV